LELGNRPGEGLRLWIQDGANGTLKPIGPEGAVINYRTCISPDGKLIAALDPDRKIVIYPVDGGNPIPVPNTQPGEIPAQWTADQKSLLVGGRDVPTRVFEIKLANGQRKLMNSYSPADLTGSSMPPRPTSRAT
jgi:hypothetical protein